MVHNFNKINTNIMNSTFTIATVTQKLLVALLTLNMVFIGISYSISLVKIIYNNN